MNSANETDTIKVKVAIDDDARSRIIDSVSVGFREAHEVETDLKTESILSETPSNSKELLAKRKEKASILVLPGAAGAGAGIATASRKFKSVTISDIKLFEESFSAAESVIDWDEIPMKPVDSKELHQLKTSARYHLARGGYLINHLKDRELKCPGSMSTVPSEAAGTPPHAPSCENLINVLGRLGGDGDRGKNGRNDSQDEGEGQGHQGQDQWNHFKCKSGQGADCSPSAAWRKQRSTSRISIRSSNNFEKGDFPLGNRNSETDLEVEKSTLFSKSSFAVQHNLTAEELTNGLSRICRGGSGYDLNFSHLNLSNKGLVDISRIENYHSLRTVNISGNYIQDVEMFGGMPYLEAINASRNEIIVFGNFRAPVALRQVDFSRNRICCLKNMDTFWSLTEANLSHNDLVDVDKFGKCKFLRVLDLSHNKIVTMNDFECPNLVALFLHNNKIEEIMPLEGCPNLRALSLTQNKIQHLEPLQSLFNLNELWLQHNRIEEIRQLDNLKLLMNLRNLYIDPNPINCLGMWRRMLIFSLPQLCYLDGNVIEPEETLIARNTFRPSHWKVCHENRMSIMLDYACQPASKIVEDFFSKSGIPPLLLLVGAPASHCLKLATLLKSKFRNKIQIGGVHSTATTLEFPSPGNDILVSYEAFLEMKYRGDFLATSHILGRACGFARSQLVRASERNAILVACVPIDVALALSKWRIGPKIILVMPTEPVDISLPQAHAPVQNTIQASDITEAVADMMALTPDQRRYSSILARSVGKEEEEPSDAQPEEARHEKKISAPVISFLPGETTYDMGIQGSRRPSINPGSSTTAPTILKLQTKGDEFTTTEELTKLTINLVNDFERRRKLPAKSFPGQEGSEVNILNNNSDVDPKLIVSEIMETVEVTSTSTSIADNNLRPKKTQIPSQIPGQGPSVDKGQIPGQSRRQSEDKGQTLGQSRRQSEIKGQTPGQSRRQSEIKGQTPGQSRRQSEDTGQTPGQTQVQKHLENAPDSPGQVTDYAEDQPAVEIKTTDDFVRIVMEESRNKIVEEIFSRTAVAVGTKTQIRGSGNFEKSQKKKSSAPLGPLSTSGSLPDPDPDPGQSSSNSNEWRKTTLEEIQKFPPFLTNDDELTVNTTDPAPAPSSFSIEEKMNKLRRIASLFIEIGGQTILDSYIPPEPSTPDSEHPANHTSVVTDPPLKIRPIDWARALLDLELDEFSRSDEAYFMMCKQFGPDILLPEVCQKLSLQFKQKCNEKAIQAYQKIHSCSNTFLKTYPNTGEEGIYQLLFIDKILKQNPKKTSKTNGDLDQPDDEIKTKTKKPSLPNELNVENEVNCNSVKGTIFVSRKQVGIGAGVASMPGAELTTVLKNPETNKVQIQVDQVDGTIAKTSVPADSPSPLPLLDTLETGDLVTVPENEPLWKTIINPNYAFGPSKICCDGGAGPVAGWTAEGDAPFVSVPPSCFADRENSLVPSLPCCVQDFNRGIFYDGNLKSSFLPVPRSKSSTTRTSSASLKKSRENSKSFTKEDLPGATPSKQIPSQSRVQIRLPTGIFAQSDGDDEYGSGAEWWGEEYLGQGQRLMERVSAGGRMRTQGQGKGQGQGQGSKFLEEPQCRRPSTRRLLAGLEEPLRELGEESGEEGELEVDARPTASSAPPPSREAEISEEIPTLEFELAGAVQSESKESAVSIADSMSDLEMVKNKRSRKKVTEACILHTREDYVKFHQKNPGFFSHVIDSSNVDGSLEVLSEIVMEILSKCSALESAGAGITSRNQGLVPPESKCKIEKVAKRNYGSSNTIDSAAFHQQRLAEFTQMSNDFSVGKIRMAGAGTGVGTGTGTETVTGTGGAGGASFVHGGNRGAGDSISHIYSNSSSSNKKCYNVGGNTSTSNKPPIPPATRFVQTKCPADLLSPFINRHEKNAKIKKIIK